MNTHNVHIVGVLHAWGDMTEARNPGFGWRPGIIQTDVPVHAGNDGKDTVSPLVSDCVDIPINPSIEQGDSIGYMPADFDKGIELSRDATSPPRANRESQQIAGAYSNGCPAKTDQKEEGKFLFQCGHRPLPCLTLN